MRASGYNVTWVALVAAAIGHAAIGCGDDGTAAPDGGDGSVDATVDAERDAAGIPLTVEADAERARIVVQTEPLRVRVERPDGSPVLTSADGAAVALGIASGGDTRYHSPLEPEPRSVDWSALAHGVEMPSDDTIVARDAEGRRARIQVSAPEPGVLRMRVAVEDGVDDVALSRLLLAADDGGYHGLGERFGHADARGTVVPMQFQVGGTASGTNEHHVPVPFFVSTEGYGLFVQTREAGAFDVAATESDEVWATFEGGELDVWVFVHDEPNEVVAMYTRHTGLPILPPRWAFAPMHWRNEWEDGAEVRLDMERVRAEDIPCTSFWIDNPWEASYNDHLFDRDRFADPETLLADMRAAGYRPLLWSTPYLDRPEDGEAPDNTAEELFVEAEERGWLVLMEDSGEPFISPAAPGATGGMVDFTSREAIDFWKGRLAPRIAEGVRAFKLDYGEDILPELLGSRPGLIFSDGRTERELHDLYNVLYHTPYREALDEGSDEGGFLLVRGSTWGGQTVADIVWPGDLDNDLREGLDGEVGGLPAAVTAVQSLAASGFPNFGSDTGGYRGGMPTREVLLRWAEHTAFTPILQLGGAGEHHNPWLYDAEAGALYRTLARAHMALVPYLRMNAIRASTDGRPPVSAPALAYPNDPGSRGDPYAYLLGEDLFVASVVEPGATERSLHLPPGDWVHWFTGERMAGPADVTVAAPIGTPPVFVRVGAVLPLLPDDMDTLVEVDDAAIVDPSARPWLRAWIFPGERREVTTEEGLGIAAERVASGVELQVTPTGDGLDDLRMRVELAGAEPPLSGVAELQASGTAVAEAADAASVEAGCDGVCWFLDGETLLVSVRSAEPTTIAIDDAG